MKQWLLFVIALALFTIPNIATVNASYWDTNYGECRNITATTAEPLGFIHRFVLNSTTINYSKTLPNGADVRIVPGNCTSPNTGATYENFTIAMWNSGITGTNNLSILYVNSSVANNIYFSIFYNNSVATTVSNITKTINPKQRIDFNNETTGNTPTGWGKGNVSIGSSAGFPFTEKYMNLSTGGQADGDGETYTTFQSTPQIYEFDISVNKTSGLESDVWLRSPDATNPFVFGIGVSNASMSCSNGASLGYGPIASTYTPYHVTINNSAVNKATFYVNGVTMGSCIDVAPSTSTQNSNIRLPFGNGMMFDNFVSYNTVNYSTLNYSISAPENPSTKFVVIQSPTAITYNTLNITLNFTTTGFIADKYWYIQNSTNTSITGNITFIAAQGSNTLTVYANDTLGNTYFSSVTYSTAGPVFSLLSPVNTTYYNNLTQYLNVTNTTQVTTWQYSLNGQANQTFTPNITFNSNAGINTLNVFAIEQYGAVSNISVNYYIFNGLNVSVFDGFNNSIGVTTWTLKGNNITNNATTSGSNPTLIDVLSFLSGNTSLIAYNGTYVNNSVPFYFNITNSSLQQINLSLYKLQYFYLQDQNLNKIQTWSMNITNGTANLTASTNNYLINLSIFDIPKGSDTITTTSVGFDQNNTAITITNLSSINVTLNVTQSVLNIAAFDELTGKALPNFTIQLTNTTASVQYIANTTTLTITNFIASGIYTISAIDTGYATRNYFYQATGSGNMLNVYLPNVTSSLNPILVSIRASTITNGGIQGILITLSKIVNSTTVVVGSGLTDNSGIVNFNMNPNVQYTLTIAFPSGTQIFQLQPSQSIYTYNEFGGNASNSNNLYSDISYQILPLNNSLSKANNQVIRLNLYSSLGTLQNATITAQWNSTSWVAFGTGNSTFITATLTFNLSGDTLPDSIPASFFVLSNNSIVNPIAGQYALIIQRTFYIQSVVAYPNLTLETILKNSAQTSGLDINSKSLFALLITIIITGFAYSKINLNPAASLILFIGLLGFFAATGWFDPLFFILAAIVGGLYYMISSGAV